MYEKTLSYAEFSAIGLLLVGCIFSSQALAEESLTLDDASCISCHVADEHKKLEDTAQLDQCVMCHAAPDITGNNNRVVAHLDALAEVDLPLANSQVDLPVGMLTPMFYKGTRLGNQPNELVLIPAGEFIRGTNNRLPDEGPQHIIKTNRYLIDKYEVTNLQYKAFIDATRHKSPKHFTNRTYPPGKADHPVVYVSWYDANEYCQWAGKRLPTDIEWEKAARSSDARMYPWGNTFKLAHANTPQRWKVLKQEGDTTPVGVFAKGVSPFGVFDMSGNVWEWTASNYKPYPGNERINENYTEDYKTLKGGSWWDCSFYKCGISAPVFNRSFFLKVTKNSSFGFRCAKDAESDKINQASMPNQ